MKKLCSGLDPINEFDRILLDIFNIVFSEGISWSKILGFIDFAGELAIKCISKYPEATDAFYKSFDSLLKLELQAWVQEHGDWMGVEVYYEPPTQPWKRLLVNGLFKILTVTLD